MKYWNIWIGIAVQYKVNKDIYDVQTNEQMGNATNTSTGMDFKIGIHNTKD